MSLSVIRKLRRFFTDERFACRREFLRSLSFCRGLTRSELGYLLQSFHTRVYNEDEPLFLEGDIGRALFVVEEGSVELSRKGPDGRRIPLAFLGPGQFLGEMALLEHQPRSASAVARERSTMLLLYRSKLDEILRRHPRIGLSIMRHLAGILSARLRRALHETPTSVEEPGSTPPSR